MHDSIGNDRTTAGSGGSISQSFNDAPSIGSMRTVSGVASGLGKVDRYELIESLDIFGSQPGFRSRDTETGIEVMICRIPPLIVSDADEMVKVRERFAEISRLHHPNIAAPLTLLTVDTVWYPSDQARDAVCIDPGDTIYVASYVQGLSLTRWAANYDDGIFPEAVALHIGRQIAKALDFAHQLRIIHGGLHPQLVQVEYEAKSEPDELPQVKLLDFGFANQLNHSLSLVSHKSASPAESKNYFAPEQHRGDPVTAATDQYALAMLMYFMLGGRQRFEACFGSKPLALASKHADAKEIERLPTLHAGAHEALSRGLASDPAQRFPDCVSLIRAMAEKPEEEPRGTPVLRRILIGMVLLALLGTSASIANWFRVKRQVESRKAATEELRLEAVGFYDHPLIARLLEEANTAYQAAEAARLKENWAEAKEKFDLTISLLSRAEVIQQDIQRYLASKNVYQKSLAVEREQNLVNYAGEAWSRIKDLVAKAEALYWEDPVGANRTYQMAAMQLNAIITELTPVLSITATAGGDAIAAQVSDGRNDWTSPVVVSMQRDVAYSLLVSHPDLEAPWSSMRLSGNAEWRRRREVNIALPEIINHTLNNVSGLSFVLVKAGRFNLGSDKGSLDERPVRRIMITGNFWMSAYEVTQQAYLKIMGENPSQHQGTLRPVENVSWHDAMRFCELLTEQEKEAGRLPDDLVYRLPTEAEWEYAAKGGLKTQRYQFSGSDDLTKVGFFVGTTRGTQKAGQAKPNRLGIYDMSGNVWEWCLDGFAPNYGQISEFNPVGPSSAEKVIRGGGWASDRRDCRIANRNSANADVVNDVTGFRVIVAKSVQF